MDIEEQCKFWIINPKGEKIERIGVFSTYDEIKKFLDDNGIEYDIENPAELCKELVYKYEMENGISEDDRMTFTYNWGINIDCISVETHVSIARIIARAYELYPHLELDDKLLVESLQHDIPFNTDYRLRENEAEAYKRLYYPQRRIKLYKTEDRHSPIESGMCGTVIKVLNNGFVDVKWDNGYRMFVNPFCDSICPLSIQVCREETESFKNQQSENETSEINESEIESVDEGPTMCM